MAGFGNTYDNLWPLTVLGASIGVTIAAKHGYGLFGLLAFPLSLVVFDLLAFYGYSRLNRRSNAFVLLPDHSAILNPPMESLVRPNGWVTCPSCNRSFMPHDRRVWDGERHHCGQQIVLS